MERQSSKAGGLCETRLRSIVSDLLQSHESKLRHQLDQMCLRQDASFRKAAQKLLDHHKTYDVSGEDQARRMPKTPWASTGGPGRRLGSGEDLGIIPEVPKQQMNGDLNTAAHSEAASNQRMFSKKSAHAPETGVAKKLRNSLSSTASAEPDKSQVPPTARAEHGAALLHEKLEMAVSKRRFGQDFMARGSIFNIDSAPSDDAGDADSEKDSNAEDKPPRWRVLASYVVSHPLFDVFCAILIVLNAVLIGVEAEIACYQTEPHVGVAATQAGISIWFAVELLLRISGELKGIRYYYYGPNANWNIFDTALIFFAVLDYSSQQLNTAGYASLARIVRILRLLRIIRTLRLIRVLRYVREFRKMVFALQGSLQTLFWSLLFLFFLLYAFAVAFTQAVTEYSRTHDDVHPELLYRYGSLSRSSYSLYLAMSQGRSWGDILAPLMDLDWFIITLFFIFISTTTFGVLNVVTSVFVESAMRSAQHYRELMIQEKSRDWETLVRHMREVFQQIDEDGSGYISMDEMSYFLADPDLRMYVEALDISTQDTKALFRLLDADNSGAIDIDEFCDGCIRIKGPAMSFDIHCVLFELDRVSARWAEFMGFAEECFLQVIEVLSPGSHLSENIRGSRLSGSIRQSLRASAVEVPS
eukprot:TRINITY_DN13326_c0_g2_i1.p1 TRINITY_DN13326_c0_g2~~TRINITY_DN13326_c0_g2_i1.p1  ORF type:complete len:717 (-),score=121.21 TRINITY_DN13326_c0_g2_i1:37-1965(-)